MTRPLKARRMALTGLAGATILLGAVPAQPAIAAPPEGYCQSAAAAAGIIEDVPWPVPVYDAAQRIWPYSTGTGVTVAVLSTGVDAAHPQLTGRVLGGADIVGGQPVANADCAGIGTAAASVIAGQKVSGVGFHGIAPDARILPVRVSVDLSGNTPEPSASAVANGINAAVAGGADVILVAHPVLGTTPELEQATAAALAAGRVVVAAVGDQHDPQAPGMQPTPEAFTPYPAALPGVIGVGAVGSSGTRMPTSQIGEYVDVVAPGADVVAAAVGGQDVYSTTAVAAGYAAATAALMLADERLGLGELGAEQKAAAVAERLDATASAGPAGEPMLGYGAGMVDPYRALNEPLAAGVPSEEDGPFAPYVPTADEIAAQEHEAAARTDFRVIAGFGALALLGGGYAVWVHRRLRTSTGRVATSVPAPRSTDDLPEYVPGSALFKPKSLD